MTPRACPAAAQVSTARQQQLQAAHDELHAFKTRCAAHEQRVYEAQREAAVLADRLAAGLSRRPPTIVSGPEIMDKYAPLCRNTTTSSTSAVPDDALVQW